MADDRVAHHFIELFQRIGHGENYVSQCFGHNATFGRLTHIKIISSMPATTKQKNAGAPEGTPAFILL